MELVGFLVDITSHLNELNLKLQGQDRTVCDLVAAVHSFQKRLEVFKSAITEAHLHFPTALDQTNGNHHYNPVAFLEKMADFRHCFDCFSLGKQVLLYIESQFLVRNVSL